MNLRTLLCAALFGVFTLGGANSGALQRKGDPRKKEAQGDDLAKLGRLRLEAAQKAYDAWFKHYAGGPFSDVMYHLSVRWLNAEVDLATNKEERITAYKAHVQRMKDWKKVFDDDEVRPPALVVAVIESFQREANYWLAKERRETR